MSRRITDTSGSRLVINANRTVAPWDTLRPEVKQLIEDVVKSRYSPTLKSLDLSDFSSERSKKYY
jgi:hypothetical protein